MVTQLGWDQTENVNFCVDASALQIRNVVRIEPTVRPRRLRPLYTNRPLLAEACGNRDPRIREYVTTSVCAVGLCTLDEFCGDRFAECGTGLVVHWVVDAGPDAGISSLFANLADEFRMVGKQVRQDLASGS